MRTRLRIMAGTVALVGLVASVLIFPLARPASAGQLPSFNLSPLPLTFGSSEPEISIDSNGTMGMVSLQWLIDPTDPLDPAAFGTHLWTGSFGSPPTEQGIVDGALQHPGKAIFGAADAAVDIGSTGRLHITTQLFVISPTFRNNQLGVSAITCPNPATPGFETPCPDGAVVAGGGLRYTRHDSGNQYLGNLFDLEVDSGGRGWQGKLIGVSDFGTSPISFVVAAICLRLAS